MCPHHATWSDILQVYTKQPMNKTQSLLSYLLVQMTSNNSQIPSHHIDGDAEWYNNQPVPLDACTNHHPASAPNMSLTKHPMAPDQLKQEPNATHMLADHILHHLRKLEEYIYMYMSQPSQTTQTDWTPTTSWWHLLVTGQNVLHHELHAVNSVYLTFQQKPNIREQENTSWNGFLKFFYLCCRIPGILPEEPTLKLSF